MNKSQLVDDVASRTQSDKATAERAVSAVVDAITEALVGRDKVTIPGFGTFETRDRDARTGRNPQTGEAIEVPATTAPAFKAGAELKRRVSGR